jgi:ubiquinone/menaquinone biosynthesis C-methylase UbiE
MKRQYMDEIEKERKWWEEHINEESELRKPRRTTWEWLYWKKTFDKIVQHYDFANKRIFVGGCGTGIFEEEISKLVTPKEIVGLDLSETMIKLARIRNKNTPNAKFIVGNLEQTDFPNNYFDVAVIIDALHHVPNAFTTLKEMKRIANDLTLCEPNALNPIRRFNELKFKNEDVKEASFYKWELKRYLKRLVYQYIYISNYNFVPSFMPENLMKVGEKIENAFQKIPLLRCISGALFVVSKRWEGKTCGWKKNILGRRLSR